MYKEMKTSSIYHQNPYFYTFHKNSFRLFSYIQIFMPTNDVQKEIDDFIKNYMRNQNKVFGFVFR